MEPMASFRIGENLNRQPRSRQHIRALDLQSAMPRPGARALRARCMRGAHRSNSPALARRAEAAFYRPQALLAVSF
jgi:hypothetical protein